MGRARALALIALGAAALAGAQASPPLFPVGIGPLPLTGESLEPERCGSCHREAHERWASSAHAKGLSNPVYEAEASHAGGLACARCHSPRHEVVADHGVDCATCHVRDGQVLTSHAVETQAHPTRQDPRLTDGTLCAACHQFDFAAAASDERARYVADEPLQNTMEEWRSSTAAANGRGCVDCHMDGHAFAGFDDRALLEKAVRVRIRARRRGDQVLVNASFLPRPELGHAFPTGDMFRVAILRIRLGDEETTYELRRHFATVSIEEPDGTVAFRVGQAADTRVMPLPAAPRRVELSVPAAEGPLRWRLELHRLPPALAEARALEDTTRVIAQGRVAVR